MKLSIIIVSWNVCEKLENNLIALFKSEVSFPFEVFVVDNNSADESVKMVSQKFPQVNLVTNQENLGFAKANNQAIKQARGEHLLLLNPDMLVMPETLEKIVNWFDCHPKAMVASCKLVDEQGNIIPHVRRFPGIVDQIAIALKLPHIFPRILNHYLAKDFDYSQESRVDSVRGSFFLMRRPLDRLPELDERYFIWFEEVDYCKQVFLEGNEVWYTPVATCIDYIGASFKQVKKGKTQNYFQDSMLKYFKKWHPIWQYLLLKAAWPLGKTIVAIAEKIKYRSEKVT